MRDGILINESELFDLEKQGEKKKNMYQISVFSMRNEDEIKTFEMKTKEIYKKK